jgi:hypothetical protein
MSAEKVIYNLLSNNVALNAVVPVSKVYPGIIPLSTVLPAIAYTLVSKIEQTSVALTSVKKTARTQVTIASKTYPQVKQVAALVEAACNHKQGIFNGVQTDSVILDNVGADFRDDDAGIFYSTLDFRIAYSE